MSLERDSNLTQTESEIRHGIIEPGLTYTVFLDLYKGTRFDGYVKVEFVGKKAEETFVEFAGKKILQVTLNEKVLENYTWEKGYLHLPPILIGHNVLKVHFENEYFNDGNGLHSFIDDEGNQYCYSQCEPHTANRIFPMFDQPNLKGRLEIMARLPSEWVFVTHELAAL